MIALTPLASGVVGFGVAVGVIGALCAFIFVWVWVLKRILRWIRNPR